MHFSFPLRHANLSKLASSVALELRRRVALDLPGDFPLCREIDRSWQFFRAPAETGMAKFVDGCRSGNPLVSHTL